MPNNREPHEEYAADLSKRRGVVAADIPEQAQKKRFIAAQGEGKSNDAGLEDSLFKQRNINAVRGPK